MTYSLVPGAGVADAVREGYRLNLPLRRVRGSGATVEPLVAVDRDGVVVEAVKLADDGSGDVVVRLYEALGARTSGPAPASLRARRRRRHRPPRAAARRRPGAPPPPADGVALALRPFQVLTLRLARA